MPIDPVIVITKETRSLEKQIHSSGKLRRPYGREGTRAVAAMVSRLRALYIKLLETTPSRAIGAAELIRIAAEWLPVKQIGRTRHLHSITQRLAGGEPRQSDLIWLSAMVTVLGEEAAIPKRPQLLDSAVKAITLPVIVWCVAVPRAAPTRDLRNLIAGPEAMRPTRFVPESF